MAPTADVEVTATFGAAARAVATDKGLLNDPFAEPLLCAVGIDYLTRAIKDHVFAADDGDGAAMTALMDALAAHTRFVDEFLADAGRAGIRQVVILASGLDSRAYRLWWPRGRRSTRSIGRRCSTSSPTCSGAGRHPGHQPVRGRHRPARRLAGGVAAGGF